MGFACSLCGQILAITIRPLLQNKRWTTSLQLGRSYSKSFAKCGPSFSPSPGARFVDNPFSTSAASFPTSSNLRKPYSTLPNQNDGGGGGMEGRPTQHDSIEDKTVIGVEEDLDLTEEERKVLQELEREQAQYLVGGRGGDYHVWDEDDQRNLRGQKLTGSVSEGYAPFENKQRIIQDVIDEIWNPIPEPARYEEVPHYFPRGKAGVFDLGELVELLRDENADELVVIAFPPGFDYADQMIIVTVRNNRQLKALATFVRKRFKMKLRKRSDRLPFFDKSVDHQGWIALDLGNIILHIFLQEIRDYYDLETLWTVGPLFDDLTNAKAPEIVQLLSTL